MKSEKKTNHRLASRPSFKWVNLLSVMVIAGLLLTPTATVLSSQECARFVRSTPPFSPWNTEIVDGPPFFYFMTDRHLRYDKSANHIPCVAYGGDHLYYSCWNIFTDSWSVEIVDGGPMVGSYAALILMSTTSPSSLTTMLTMPRSSWHTKRASVGRNLS